MAENYEVGKSYYLPVKVFEVMDDTYTYPARIEFENGNGCMDGRGAIKNEPNLLLTAEEIYANRQMADKIEHLTDMMDYGRKKYDEIEELKSSNAELEALLKEVMATRDEAIKQNNELIAENNKLKADCDEWKDTAYERLNAIQTLSTERNKVMASNAELKEWYDEANKTASEAAEANDELKAKIAELKAERDKFAKTAKDKADLANKACDEGYDAHVDLVTARAAIDHLQEENKKLKQELKDAEATYNVVANTSIKRKNRVTTMEEVIVALVEKIRRLEGDKK